MKYDPVLLPNMKKVLKQKLGGRLEKFLIPPPVFFTLMGQFLEFNQASSSLSAKFPVLSGYLNPYGYLQGGIIAALIDNTTGPLSILVAPPNVTRSLEIKFSRPITKKIGYVIVLADLVERQGNKLLFKAVVRSPDGNKLASARAYHWILPNEDNYV